MISQFPELLEPEGQAELLTILRTRCFKRTGATEVACVKAAALIEHLLEKR